MIKGDKLKDYPVKGKNTIVSGEVIRISKSLITIKLSAPYIGANDTSKKGDFKFFNLSDFE